MDEVDDWMAAADALEIDEQISRIVAASYAQAAGKSEARQREAQFRQLEIKRKNFLGFPAMPEATPEMIEQWREDRKQKSGL